MKQNKVNDRLTVASRKLIKEVKPKSLQPN